MFQRIPLINEVHRIKVTSSIVTRILKQDKNIEKREKTKSAFEVEKESGRERGNCDRNGNESENERENG